LLVLELVLIDLIGHLIAPELFRIERLNYGIGCGERSHNRRGQPAKLRPCLPLTERWLDIVPYSVMVGLGLNDCQPSRLIGLGSQHNDAFSGCHNVV